jgi:ABC-2 type transport system ATP-binding protein
MSERGVAILMSTHTLEVAQEMCQRLSIILKGKIIAQGRWTKFASSRAAPTITSRPCSFA